MDEKKRVSILPLFLTGLVQVYFVALNTYLIANSFVLGVFVAGFLISFIWTYNVRRVVAGLLIERIFYSLGAACGSVLGLLTSMWIVNLIN